MKFLDLFQMMGRFSDAANETWDAWDESFKTLHLLRKEERSLERRKRMEVRRSNERLGKFFQHNFYSLNLNALTRDD